MTDRDAMPERGTEMRKYFYYGSFGQFSLANDRNGKNALALDARSLIQQDSVFFRRRGSLSIATISSAVC